MPAAASPWRAEVVAGASLAGGLRRPPSPFEPCRPRGQVRQRRLDWADLLRRVYLVDVLSYARCGGRRVVLASITNPEAIEAILTHLRLRPRPPPAREDLPPRSLQAASQVR